MQDKPAAGELLKCVEAFLREEIVPATEGRKRFHALVAANATAIVARELELGPAALDREVSSLWKLLGRSGRPPKGGDAAAAAAELNRELCERIDAGEADQGAFRNEVLLHLMETVDAKLAIDNPKALER